VLGRDRPSDRTSGYGGSGDTGASSIDIVTGRFGDKTEPLSGEQVYVDANLKRDAARIYISQRADIDDYFKLWEKKVKQKAL